MLFVMSVLIFVCLMTLSTKCDRVPLAGLPAEFIVRARRPAEYEAQRMMMLSDERITDAVS